MTSELRMWRTSEATVFPSPSLTMSELRMWRRERSDDASFAPALLTTPPLRLASLLAVAFSSLTPFRRLFRSSQGNKAAEVRGVDLTVFYVLEGGKGDAMRVEGEMDDHEKRVYMTPSSQLSPALERHAEERELEAPYAAKDTAWMRWASECAVGGVDKRVTPHAEEKRRRRRTRNALVAAGGGALALAAGLWLYKSRDSLKEWLNMGQAKSAAKQVAAA